MRQIGSFQEEGLIPIQLDVNDEASIQQAAEQCADTTILVNNAGIALLNEHPVEANIITTTQKILETNLLTDTEKKLAAEVSMDAGAAFLKTSTGWNGGATVADVKLLKEVAQDRVEIKASGGIRTAEQALELILAGATRLGTSRGVDLIRQRAES